MAQFALPIEDITVLAEQPRLVNGEAEINVKVR